MTLTEADVRSEPAGRRLDGWLHESMGKVVNWRHGHPFSDEVGLLGWNMVPAYSTDPAACAELRRRLWASGKYTSLETRFAHDTVTAFTARQYLDLRRHVEPIGTDPIAAELVAWCKVALLAELSKGGT